MAHSDEHNPENVVTIYRCLKYFLNSVCMSSSPTSNRSSCPELGKKLGVKMPLNVVDLHRQHQGISRASATSHINRQALKHCAVGSRKTLLSLVGVIARLRLSLRRIELKPCSSLSSVVPPACEEYLLHHSRGGTMLPKRSPPVSLRPLTQTSLPRATFRPLTTTVPKQSAGHEGSHGGDGAHAHESHYDPPGGWLWGLRPGEKYEKEGWEIWAKIMSGALILTGVAYAYKPDTT